MYYNRLQFGSSLSRKQTQDFLFARGAWHLGTSTAHRFRNRRNCKLLCLLPRKRATELQAGVKCSADTASLRAIGGLNKIGPLVSKIADPVAKLESLFENDLNPLEDLGGHLDLLHQLLPLGP